MWRYIFKEKSSKIAKKRLKNLLLSDRIHCATEINKKGLKIHV